MTESHGFPDSSPIWHRFSADSVFRTCSGNLGACRGVLACVRIRPKSRFPSRMPMSRTRKSIILLLLAALLAPGLLAPREQAAAELAIPDSPAGDQLAWALEQVESAAGDIT